MLGLDVKSVAPVVLTTVSPQEATTTTVKIVHRKLRIRVLDCRSGLPLRRLAPELVLLAPLNEPWDEKAHSAVRFMGMPEFDLTKRYAIPVSKSGQPIVPLGFTKNNRAKLHEVLNALGYDCGNPSAQFGERGFKALKAFQVDWYHLHPKEPKPSTFSKEVTSEWQNRIITEFNRRFIKTVQYYLTALGYPCDQEEGVWGEETKTAFTQWQRNSLRSSSPFTTFNSKGDFEQRRKVIKKLQEEWKPFLTDENGVLFVTIPVARIRAGFRIKIRFKDFTVVAEREGWRTDHNQSPTRFLIEWEDTQNGRNWGWRLRPFGNTEQRQMLPEFSTDLEFVIPAQSEADWTKLADSELQSACFSPFYKKTKDHAEIVVFGLVWCQPLWDGIKDPEPGKLISEKVCLQSDEDRNCYMHLVTTYFDLGGRENYGGRGYGLYEYRSNPRWRGKDKPDDALGGHRGLDVFSEVGDNIFAIHGGNVHRHDTSGDAGKYVALKWSGTGRTQISYLHLSGFVINDNVYVRAGAILGLAGRTGNLGLTSRWPTHCHLNVGADVAMRQTPNAANKICIPSNGTHLIFPCHCEVTASDENPGACNFSDKKFVNTCWAVAELRCPHICVMREKKIDVCKHSFDTFLNIIRIDIGILASWMEIWGKPRRIVTIR